MMLLNLAARIAGAILLTPPGLIERYLPMMAPLPLSFKENEHRQKVNQLISSLYQDLDAGFHNVQDELHEWAVEVDDEDEDKFDSSHYERKPWTYGEVTPLGARQLFDILGMTTRTKTIGNNNHAVKEKKEVVFVDLGSGVGKLVIQAYLELPVLTKSMGIELSCCRHEVAVQAWERLVLARSSGGKEDDDDDDHSLLDISKSGASLELVQADFFNVDVSRATHIYVSSLCFTQQMMQQLEEKLYTQAINLECVASLQAFSPGLFGEPRIEYVEMSWTRPQGAEVYVYSLAKKQLTPPN
jgi:hypothetical protein